MSYQLSELNYRAQTEPKLFLQEGDAVFRQKIEEIAKSILERRKNSSIVLLSGPSGSGKTTTALKLEEMLRHMGAGAHVISMDHYFLSLDSETAPRTPTGEYDFESPDCLDWELLSRHLNLLEIGEEILIPRFEFTSQIRNDEAGQRLRLQPGEIVILEGIHALRDDLTLRHPKAFKLYVSTRSDILDGETLCFERMWMRLVRRSVRDHQFRGFGVEQTLAIWDNVMDGQRRYIAPFLGKADVWLDTSLPYEVSVMKQFALPLLQAVPKTSPHWEKIRELLPAFDRFFPIDPAFVPEDSLLREFIGGGSYHY